MRHLHPSVVGGGRWVATVCWCLHQHRERLRRCIIRQFCGPGYNGKPIPPFVLQILWSDPSDSDSDAHLGVHGSPRDASGTVTEFGHVHQFAPPTFAKPKPHVMHPPRAEHPAHSCRAARFSRMRSRDLVRVCCADLILAGLPVSITDAFWRSSTDVLCGSNSCRVARFYYGCVLEI
jgi:hypothetical protein